PQRYRHHPCPHSFPTRRSSDLEPVTFLVGPDRLRYELVVNYVDKDRIRGYLSTPKDKTLAAARHSGVCSEPKPLTSDGLSFVILDRKSTRLNSSHEWISYAVFC